MVDEIKFKANHFNLSIGRILSRILLTGIIGVIFGIAMFPFLRVADDLLEQQKASIGGENIIKMVALWGIFTLIVSLVTFWKKRFRMTSIFLIICWVISLGFGILMFAKNNSNLDCKRSIGYPLSNEFDRVLNLIAQRLNIENNYDTYWGNAFNYRNCLNIQYSDINAETGTEGLFVSEDPTLQNLQILINPQYKSFDDLSIATVLNHELTHVGQYINQIKNKKSPDCFKDEAEAFTAQAIFLSQLNNEEKRSIFSRIRENVGANPAFEILLTVDQRQGESFRACEVLKTENNLTESQFNECVWTGLTNKLELDVKNSPYYQQQCKVQQ